MALPPLTAAQMETFERDGAILVDTPFSPSEMDKIEGAWDRITTQESTTATDEDYLDMLTHPFFESVACQVLRAEAVQVLETYPHNRPPSTQEEGETREERDYRTWGGGHLDVQITRSAWEATPRREMLAIWIWCNDVPLERGPMRVLKGSHLPIADMWEERIRDPAKLAQLPRVHGLSPNRGEHEPGSGGSYSAIPELLDVPWSEQVPEKVTAKRGQALVFSQALLHQATANEDTVSRKAHIMSWTPASVPGFLATGRIEGMRTYHAAIRAKLLEYKPDRAQLVPEKFIHDISEYGNAPEKGGVYWEEMWNDIVPKGEQQAKLMQDIMGNVWSLEGDTVSVLPAQSPDSPVAVEAPGSVVALAPDFNGMVWCSTGGRELFRLNPRGPGYTDDGMTKRDTPACEPVENVGAWSGEHTHAVWVPFPADALPEGGAIVSLARSVTSDRCVVTLDSGATCEVELTAAGEATASSPAAPSAGGPSWRMLPGLLPCGNHDIFASECGGKLYVTGGALWWRGYPALMHEFDDLWEFDPASMDSESAWKVAGHMPDSKCFNGIATLGTKLYLPGGCKSGPWNEAEAANKGTGRDLGLPNARVDQDSLFIYDTADGSWTVGPSLNHARNECVAEAVNGRVYAFGWTTVVESIAEGETEWRIEPTPCPVAAGGGKAGQCSSTELDGIMYICGDFGLLAFDPAGADGAGSWETIDGCPTTSAPAMSAHDGEIYVMSGYNPDHTSPLKGVVSYSPADKTWRSHAELPSNNSWGAAASINGNLLAIGGAHWNPGARTFCFDPRVFALQPGAKI